MKDIVALAKKRANKFGVRNVVVPTNTGRTASKVYEAFGEDYLIIAVGNPVSAHARGLVSHQGVNEETRKSLEQKGIKIVLQDQSLFQAVGHGRQGFVIGGKRYDIGAPDWVHHRRIPSLQEVIEDVEPQGDFNPVAIIYNTLQLFGRRSESLSRSGINGGRFRRSALGCGLHLDPTSDWR